MKTYLIILLLSPLTFSQWEAGVSYKLKNEIPENGFGFSISRNLPYQAATFGIKLRAELNLFRQKIKPDNSGTEQKFLSEDYNLNIIGEYYFKFLYPYFGIGTGYSELRSRDQNWQGVVFSLLIGSNFRFSDFIKPYIEIQGYKYFADFESLFIGKDISTYQLRLVLGVNISINTLDN